MTTMTKCSVCGGTGRVRKWHPYKCKPYEDKPCWACRPADARGK